MVDILIDTDPGVDDAQAIAFALAHPEINVKGLTTVFGNADVELTTRNALRLLEIFDRPDIPVAKGAAQPLVLPRFDSPDFVHGKDAMGNINLDSPTHQPCRYSAAEFIVQQATESNGKLCLVAIGPLTNLALALQLDAELASKVQQVIIMGGTVIEPGNVSPVAEANFMGDPHAAEAVLAADWPTTVVGLDVTHQTLLYEGDLVQVRQACGDAGQLLWNSSRYYLDFYRESLGLTDDSESCAPMHDASALIQLVAPQNFQLLRGTACVALDGPAMGQLILDRKGHDYYLDYWRDRTPIDVAMQVDGAQVQRIWVETVIKGFAR